MIDVRRIDGDSEVARELLVAMEAYVESSLGPVNAGTTSTVDPGEMIPPGGASVVVLEDGVPVAGGGMRRLGDDVTAATRATRQSSTTTAIRTRCSGARSGYPDG